MTRLDRRTFIFGVAGAGVLAACGDDGESGSDEPDTTAVTAGTPAFLVPTFPDGFRAESTIIAGAEQRISFVLRDDVDTMRANAPDQVDIEISFGDEVIASGPQAVRRDGILTPYYPVFFTAATPGEYVARAIDLPDVAPIPFVVREQSEVAIVQVGDPMRPVDTPTLDDARGVDPICTRATPCDFHAQTLTEALGTGKPTVLIISTPGFCQTDICGPVLELLIDAADGRDDLAVVHAEVYVDPSLFADGEFPATTEAVNTYALPFEPQLLVADEAGTIVARLDTTWDRSELDAALALV